GLLLPAPRGRHVHAGADRLAGRGLALERGRRSARHRRLGHARGRHSARRPRRLSPSVGAISLALEFRPLDPAHAAELEAFVLANPSIAANFEKLARPGGAADTLDDKHIDPEPTMLAYSEGALVGFAIAVRLHDPTGVPFVFLSLGVGERHRRQGV